MEIGTISQVRYTVYKIETRMITMTRVTYLDNLKTALIVLVLGHHIAIAFGGDGGWYYIMPAPSALTHKVLGIFNTINQSFFMSLFFFISAYFIPPSYDKKLPKAFLLDKCKRLGIPLVVFFCCLSPLVHLWVNWLDGHDNASYFSMGPLWFVVALLVFNFIYVCYSLLSSRTIKMNCPGFFSSLLLIILMGTINFIVRLWFPVGSVTWGFQFGYFPLYLLFFIGGIVASRNNWLVLGFKRFSLPWVLMLIISVVFIIYAHQWSISIKEQAAGGFNLYAALLAFWEPLSCFSWIVVTITTFQFYFDFSNSVTKYLSGAAYTVYVFQPFFIIFITVIWDYFQWQGLCGFMGAWIICSVLSFYLSGWIRRIPMVDTVL